jgi:hypothetical protein
VRIRGSQPVCRSAALLVVCCPVKGSRTARSGLASVCAGFDGRRRGQVKGGGSSPGGRHGVKFSRRSSDRGDECHDDDALSGSVGRGGVSLCAPCTADPRRVHRRAMLTDVGRHQKKWAASPRPSGPTAADVPANDGDLFAAGRRMCAGRRGKSTDSRSERPMRSLAFPRSCASARARPGCWERSYVNRRLGDHDRKRPKEGMGGRASYNSSRARRKSRAGQGKPVPGAGGESRGNMEKGKATKPPRTASGRASRPWTS